MNCGECLMEHVRIVSLVDGRCPECGADYADYQPNPQRRSHAGSESQTE